LSKLIQLDKGTAEKLAGEKEVALFEYLQSFPSLLVAYSGGTDSAYLAWAAHRALGTKALALTALSASYSAYDRQRAVQFAQEADLRHECIVTNEMANPLYAANAADRCFHCKDELFTQMNHIAAARGFAAIAYGINLDDTSDIRPGHRAAAEHQVVAPLLEARLTKQEIRTLARAAGLSMWDRPASACLSSRIPYGTAVTAEALARVEAGEAILREHGFRQFRVRYYEDLARIEIDPTEMPRAVAMGIEAALAARFASIGFTRVELDRRGYRQGSLNEALRPQ
jgi:pyridinium-3,5-biscarboxylic acid mononucleotide sulfurtransferase